MAFLTSLKNAAIEKLPGLIESAEPQIEAALVKAVSGMPPARVAMLSTNLKKLSAAVDKASLAQTSPPVAAGKRKSSKKTRRNKHK